MMFFLYLPIYLIAWALSFPLVPAAVLFCDEQGRLPKILRWLEAHDALGWGGPQTENATAKTTEKFGRKVGLMHFLWRNKAYTLRYWMRAEFDDDAPRSQSGTSIPARWGYSYWRGKVGRYWEFQPRFGFGKFHLYLRVGWKMKPYFDTDVSRLSDGLFTGVSIRSDDWDDFHESE